MLTLPIEFVNVMVTFAPIFSKRVFQHVQVLIVGAILAIGKRTVTQALRVCGLMELYLYLEEVSDLPPYDLFVRICMLEPESSVSKGF